MSRKSLTVLTIGLCIILIGCQVEINPSAEIVVKNGNVKILSGSNFEFGEILVGNHSTPVTFTVENVGRSKLVLNESPEFINIQGDTSDFIIDKSKVVKILEPGESFDFSIIFAPQSEGVKSALVKIYSNDEDQTPFGMTLSGDGVVPEINIKQDATDIPSGTGSFDFSEIKVGETSAEYLFTIENLGTGVLKLTGSPELISISGADASMFTIDQTKTVREIDSGEVTSFKVVFTPSSVGDKTATISIENNDSDENPYTFTFTGKGMTAPEINIKQGLDDILSGTGVYDFGMVLVGDSSSPVIFTIENFGTIDLELTGSPKISIAGADAAQFTVNQLMTKHKISNAETTTFTIAFNPAGIGGKTATISISNNDYDENPYTFAIKGYGFAYPEINVQDFASNSILCSTGVYDFGTLRIGTDSSETFTIQNLGLGDLILSGNPKVSITGAGANALSVTLIPTSPISYNNSTTFSIKFAPIAVQHYSATVSIANNDPDENPYTFTINGNGADPEINIQDSASNNIPSSTGSFDFDYIQLNYDSSETFKIQNLGLGDLILTGTPQVSISGAGASAFTVTSQPSSPIAQGTDTTFVIKFAPTAKQLYSATVSIANSDSDENPYTFTIEGTGFVYTKGDVNGDGYPDVVVGAPGDDDGYHSEAGCAFIFFGKQNWNTSYDASDANVKIICTYGWFGYSVSSAGDINDDGFEDIIIGAPFSSEAYYASGDAYIFLGRSKWNSTYFATDADIILTTENRGDHFSWSVSSAGDVNKDGFDDVIVGARDADGGVGPDLGCAYIFFGKSSWSSKISASNADVKIVGDLITAYFGRSVSSAGDINGDGFSDIIIGAKWDDTAGSESGAAYIYFGRLSWSSLYYSSNSDVIIVGENIMDRFGTCCSKIGDINNDGIDDFSVCNQESKTYVFFGRQHWISLIDASNADIIITISGCVTYAGDFNDDGIDDLIISDDNANFTGCAYIFIGRQAWNKTYSFSSADVTLAGSTSNDCFGNSISALADVNGDGIDDIIIGACDDDDGGEDSGCAFIFYGRRSPASVLNASNANVKLVGDDYDDKFGTSVAGAK